MSTPLKSLNSAVTGETWTSFLSVFLGTWLAVWLYAALHNQRGIYPADWYPVQSLGLLITQTIQITAYSSGALFSIILLLWTWHRRKFLPGPLQLRIKGEEPIPFPQP